MAFYFIKCPKNHSHFLDSAEDLPLHLMGISRACIVTGEAKDSCAQTQGTRGISCNSSPLPFFIGFTATHCARLTP